METIVLYPSPGIGHIISMVELGKLILTQNPSLSITILISNFPFNTGSTSPYISSITSSYPSITFHTLPSLPLLLGDPSNYQDYEQAAFELPNNNIPNLRLFLNSLSSHVSAFIIDFFTYPTLQITHSLHIPTYFFITCNAACLALFLNFPAFDKAANNQSFRNLKTTLFELPGLFPIPGSQMVECMLDRGASYYEFVKMGGVLPGSDGIIVNTFESLEAKTVKALREGICLPGVQLPPIYCIGPLFANRGEGANKEQGGERNECLNWLDSQPNRSVVYLCFGSRGLFSKEQIGEIAVGLQGSGVRFLWVIRAPPCGDKGEQFLPPPEPDLNSLLPVGFLDRVKDRGMVVKSWAPQIAILAHDAVAGFVTHCGWNSILEAVEAGVPMVAWPLYAEQRFNKITLVKEMKIALPMDESEDRFVGSDEVERRVKQIVNSEVGDAIRKKMFELSQKAKAALSEGGSSKAALGGLVESWKGRGKY